MTLKWSLTIPPIKAWPRDPQETPYVFIFIHPRDWEGHKASMVLGAQRELRTTRKTFKTMEIQNWVSHIICEKLVIHLHISHNMGFVLYFIMDRFISNKNADNEYEYEYLGTYRVCTRV
jgi:hypothetical protein